MKSVIFEQLTKTLSDPTGSPAVRAAAAEEMARTALELGNDTYQALLLVAEDPSVDCEVSRAVGRAIGALVAVNYDRDPNFLARDFSADAVDGYAEGWSAAMRGKPGFESRFGPGTEFLKDRTG